MSYPFKMIMITKAFYECYNYEPDEQSKEIQDKSICKIDIEKGRNWLNTLIPDVSIKKLVLNEVY